MKPYPALVALLATAVVATAGATSYALYARDSAIRGWAEAASLNDRLAEKEAEASTSRILSPEETINYSQMTNQLSDYNSAMKWLIMERAGIKDIDSDLRIGLLLTSHLYNETNFSGEYISTNNNVLRYFLTENNKTFNYCSDLSQTLVWLLKFFEIDSRIVNIAANSFFEKERGDTHTFVEARLEGENVVLDPTFNTTYRCSSDGKDLDAISLFECVKDGNSIFPKYISIPRPKRSVGEYYISLEELFYAMDAVDGQSKGFYSFEYPQQRWLMDTQKKWAQGDLPIISNNND